MHSTPASEMSEPTTEGKNPIQWITEPDGIYRNSRTEVLYEPAQDRR